MLGSKRIAYPPDTPGFEGIEQQDIEPARRFRAGVRPPHQVETRGGDQARLLGGGYALRGAAETLVAAVADFGEHQRAAFLGDKVDFTVPAAPVARQHPQARLAQQIRA